MDYGRILTRAWEITWRWKILWVLGFLAGLTNGGGGGGGGGNNYTRIANGTGTQFNPGPNIVALLVGLACVAFILGIVLWVLSTIARGGLIAGVTQVEDTGTTSLGRAWSAGMARFWTLFGIGILTALPIIVLVILGGIGALVAVGGVAGLTNGAQRAMAGSIGLLVCCGVGFCCGILLLALVLEQIRTYAERAAMLENLGWLDAFSRGWQVLRSHLGPTLMLWLIFLVIGLVFGAVIVGGFLAVLAPILAIGGLSGGFDNGLTPALIGTLCVGGLIGIIIAAVIGSVVQTFTSASWTLAYMQLTNLRPSLPGAASEVVPAPLA